MRRGAFRIEAFKAAATAASPLTIARQASSGPLRLPLRVILSPLGEIVTTHGSRSIVTARRKGFSSGVVIVDV